MPLFVEELTKAVLESGLLTDAGDHYELTGPLPPLAIPSTLHNSLMARLDRLAPVKEVAQIGACIGREFGHELLAAVAPLSANELGDALAQLGRSELVFCRGTPPEATYTFKHALVQDAAYQPLLEPAPAAARAHRRGPGAGLPGDAETEPELLAHHCTQARLGRKAVGYWLKAGELAIRRSASAEAIAQLRKGLELVEGLPGDLERAGLELELQTALGGALIAARGFAAPEAGEAFARARELCRELGRPPQLFPVLYGQYVFHLVRAELDRSLEIAEELLRAAQEQDETAPLVMGTAPSASRRSIAASWPPPASTSSRRSPSTIPSGIARWRSSTSSIRSSRARATCRGASSPSATPSRLGRGPTRRWPGPGSSPIPPAWPSPFLRLRPFAVRRRPAGGRRSRPRRCGHSRRSKVSPSGPRARYSRAGRWPIKDRHRRVSRASGKVSPPISATGAANFVPHFLALLAQAQQRQGQVAEAEETVAERWNGFAAPGSGTTRPSCSASRGELLLARPTPDPIAPPSSAWSRRSRRRAGSRPKRGSSGPPCRSPGCGVTRAGAGGARPARPDPRLVHRGLRHRRSEGSQGAARRVGLMYLLTFAGSAGKALSDWARRLSSSIIAFRILTAETIFAADLAV